MRKVGIGLLAVLALLLLPAVDVLSRKRPEPIRSTTHPTLRRTDCIACHAPIADEWRQSFHYRSLTGPHWSEVRRLGYLDIMDRFRKPCVNCHAPANVLDLAADATAHGDLGVECTPNLFREPAGTIPAARSDDVNLGVDCVACHVSRRGITGAGRSATSVHEVIADRRFQDPAVTANEICRTCHRATVEAWAKTRFAAEGTTCLDCHMPDVRAASVAGGPEHVRRSHRFVGDKDEAMLRNAVHASLRISGPSEARFHIINDRVGHYFPSGGNWVRVFFTTYDAANRKVAERVEGLGRDEGLILPVGSDKRLAYGEQKEFVISLPEGHGHIDAAVRYHDFIKAEKTVLTLSERY